MDGAYITAPNIGIFGVEEKWIIEQEGWLPMWQWKTTRKTCSMAAMHSWKKP